MSLTLGEKLRQAREERGISISEVAEQTRISPHYLDSIEHDDYKPLPGGIFNKGFVKSYAKYVNIDEQEALQDYARLLAAGDGTDDAATKVYKPEVLTDDRSGNSMIPTVIVAVVILGLMTAGVLYLVDYLRNQPATTPPVAANTSNSNTVNANMAVMAKAPDFATSKIDFKAVDSPVSLTSVVDGKSAVALVAAGSSVSFSPKESLKLSYSKSLAASVQLLINNKSVTPPATPFNPKRAAIEFEINKDNFPQIWQSGAISNEVAPAVTDANVQPQATPPPATVTTTPIPRPSVAVNAANTGKPSPIKAGPTPKPTVIVIPSANRPE